MKIDTFLNIQNGGISIFGKIHYSYKKGDGRHFFSIMSFAHYFFENVSKLNIGVYGVDLNNENLFATYSYLIYKLYSKILPCTENIALSRHSSNVLK